jgi:hypothetical protein
MIAEALKYPFKEDDWPRKMLFGSLLILSTILIVPMFTFMGYLLRVMREDSMPEFDELLDMTIDGAKASVLFLVYVMIPMSVVFTFETGMVANVALGALLLSVYLIYSIFYELSNDGWRSAFSLQVLKNAFSLRYLVAWLGGLVVSTLLSIIWAISLILILPILLYPTLYFYNYVFMFRIMTEAIESQ